MTFVQSIALPLAAESTTARAASVPPCRQLDVELRPEDRALWCYLNPRGRASFTEDLLEDLRRVQDFATRSVTRPDRGADAGLRWVVLASRTPGVFSLGGDLTVFSRAIREGDREGLRRYAHTCVEVAHRNSTGYGGDAVTVGLAQGEAMGGGFESLLSCDVIVAERRARFALPEVLFNLFPGMGAHPFLARRVGPAAAQRMILSGETHSAEALHALGVVDLLVEDGAGEAAVRDYIRAKGPRGHAHAAAYKAARRLFPVTLDDLRDVADIWVDAALGLSAQDLRRMSHLIAAQDRARHPRRDVESPSRSAG